MESDAEQVVAIAVDVASLLPRRRHDASHRWSRWMFKQESEHVCEASFGVAVIAFPYAAVMPRLGRGIQYAAASPYPRSASGILDRPLSRAMTVSLSSARTSISSLRANGSARSAAR